MLTGAASPISHNPGMATTKIDDQSQDKTTQSSKRTENGREVTITNDLPLRMPEPTSEVLPKQSTAEGATQISLKVTNNQEAENFCWAYAEYRFCQIISPQDFYQLTGEEQGKAIITIDGREYAVTPHNNLNRGEIICNAFYKELASSPLQASGCQKKIRKHEKIAVSVRMLGDTVDQPIEPSMLMEGINTAITGMPVNDNREYRLQCPLYNEKEDEYMWREYAFTVSLPHSNKIAGESEKWSRDDDPVVDVFSGGARGIHLDPGDSNTKIKRANQTLEPRHYRFAVKCTADNRIGMNCWQFRRLMPKVQPGDEALALVRQGPFYYYAVPNYPGDDARSEVEVVSVFQKSGFDKVESVYQTLLPADQCDINLSWHRCFIHAHGLDQQAIEEQVRRALKYVPLQEGKKFLVGIKKPARKTTSQIMLEGVVTRVTGETGELPGVFQCHDDTRLSLQASEPAILDGSNPKGRTEAEVIDKLSQNLWGVEDVAQQIAQRVILPEGHRETGILLYGPPGTGKSALSRNIGSALHALDPCVVFISPTALMKQNPADSAKALEGLIDKIQFPYEPSVLVIDEIDTMFQSRKTRQESDIQQALRSKLQSLMDNGEQGKERNLVIVGTTNVSPDHFDPALLRMNRFSVQLHMGLPDQKQRKEIVASLFARQESPEITINNKQVEWLSRVTENKSGADITHLVNEIVANAKSRGNWNNESVLQLTNEQIQSVLFPLDRACIYRKKAMKSVHSEEPSSKLTKQEQAAITQCQSTLQKCTSGSGKKAVIQVNAEPGARPSRFCLELLKQVDIRHVNYFDAVVPGSDDMIEDAEKALSNASGYIRSVIVIDRVDKLIKQASAFNNPVSIGSKWAMLGDNTSAALVFTTEESQIDGNQVTEIMGLPAPRKMVTLPAGLKQEDMKAMLKEKYPKVTQEKIEEVIEKLGADVDISCFVDLFDFHSITNDEGDVCDWDMKELIHDYVNRKNHADNSLYH